MLAFSTGNHGQAVAASARMTGTTAMIVMPQDAPQGKVDGCRWWGSEVVFYAPATQDREEVGRAVHRIVDKLLHQPTVRAKELAVDGRFGEYEDALRQLFDLHAEGSQL